MILHTKRTVIELERRATARLDSPAGSRIECLRGRLWVTELETADDILLEAGQSCVTRRDGGDVVVQALRPSSVMFQVASAEAHERSTTWMDGLRNWFRPSPSIGRVRA